MLGGDTRGKAVRPSKCDITWLDPTGHVMCFGSGVDDLVDCLHGEIECHKLALRSLRQLTRRVGNGYGVDRSIPQDVSLLTLPQR